MNDDFQQLLSRTPLVEADGEFRARLRREAGALYARRTRALEVVGRSRGPLTWLPWGFAAAASVLAVFFHLQGDTGMIRSLEGATLARQGDDWVRVGAQDKSLASELYVAPGGRSEVARPGVKAVLEDDCHARFNDAEKKLELDGGVAEVEGQNYRLTLSGGGEFRLTGKAQVNCRTGQVRVRSGRLWHRVGGQMRETTAGGQLQLEAALPAPAPSSGAPAALLVALAPGQSLGDLLTPMADGRVPASSPEGQIRLQLFTRLGGREEDLKAAFRILESLDAEHREKLWKAMSQAPMHKVLAAEQAVARQVPAAVKASSALGVEYLVERLADNSFRVTRSGRTDVWSAAELKRELDPDLVARFPREWKLGRSE